MRHVLIKLIAGYRYFISPMLGSNCRFHPSCSCYAQKALQQHGTIKGAWLAIRRILRCHPWHPGGYDPVPDTTPTVDTDIHPTHTSSTDSHG